MRFPVTVTRPHYRVAFVLAATLAAACHRDPRALNEQRLRSGDTYAAQGRHREAIIEYRKKNGGFKSVSDLDNVPGFGAKTVEGLKKDITVGNAKAAAASQKK